MEAQDDGGVHHRATNQEMQIEDFDLGEEPEKTAGW
jgi:hypothetical protein